MALQPLVDNYKLIRVNARKWDRIDDIVISSLEENIRC
jgi:hypothetical protein